MMEKFILLTILVLISFAGVGNSQTANANSDSQSGDKPLKIIKKPISGSMGKDCSESSARVSIRVTFDKSAKVTDIEIVIPSGCESFDENAISKARQIKFEPAMKNGEAITVKKIIQYDFRRY